jgi:PST family polysaccharide transporter
MNTISSNYFVFISAVFTVYVLPRFSEQKLSSNLLNEYKSVFKTLIPFVTLGMLCVYILRFPIIKLLFTNEFLSISELFKWQLIADWFRVVFLIFGYYLIANKRLIDYFIVETFSFTVLISFSIFLINSYGIEGVVIANAVRYIGCLILVVFLLRKKLFK